MKIKTFKTMLLSIFIALVGCSCQNTSPPANKESSELDRALEMALNNETVETSSFDIDTVVEDLISGNYKKECSLEDDTNFLYSKTNEFNEYHMQPDTFEALYDDLIGCTYFVVDEKTKCIHFDGKCPESSTAAMSSMPVITFYEAIIFEYNYCKKCFSPLIEYYSE